MDHFWPNFALKKRQNVVTPNVESGECGIYGKSLVKFGRGNVAALKMRPGVVIGIGGVDGPNGVKGESLGGLKAVKRLKGAAQDHAPKIPQNCRNCRRTSHTHDRRAIPTSEPH